MSLAWTQAAVDQLRAIEDYIAQTSPTYAQAVIQRIVDRANKVTTFPRLGAEVAEFRDESVREVLERPYRIIYRVSEAEVKVLAVVHGARELPPNVI